MTVTARAFGDIAVGDELTPLVIDVTASVIVSGAIASRDFMPVHHDRDYAQAQGAPDIFMNILTSNGYVSRYVTDWSGGDSLVREVSTRLGAPAVPGKPLQFRGLLLAEQPSGADRRLEVLVRADSALGNHLTATVTVDVPA